MIQGTEKTVGGAAGDLWRDRCHDYAPGGRDPCLEMAVVWGVLQEVGRKALGTDQSVCRAYLAC